MGIPWWEIEDNKMSLTSQMSEINYIAAFSDCVAIA